MLSRELHGNQAFASRMADVGTPCHSLQLRLFRTLGDGHIVGIFLYGSLLQTNSNVFL